MKINNADKFRVWLLLQKRKYVFSIAFLFLFLSISAFPEVIVIHKVFILLFSTIVFSFFDIECLNGNKRFFDIGSMFSIPVLIYCVVLPTGHGVVLEIEVLVVINSVFNISLFVLFYVVFFNIFNSIKNSL